MINDGNKNHFEHSFIFENLNKKKINPGCVIHHKDHNGLNNNFKNLEVMTRVNGGYSGWMEILHRKAI